MGESKPPQMSSIACIPCMHTIAYTQCMRISTARDVGHALRDQRRARGMTQADLADAIGVSRLWVSKVESGRHPRAASDLVLSALQAVGYLVTVQVPDEGP